MEKKIWSKPEMNEFVFAANEYVAACLDTKNTYLKFVCDFGNKFLDSLFDIYVGVYDNNKTKEENAANSELLTKDYIIPGTGNYHACGDTHYVQKEDGKDWTDYFWVGWADSDSRDGEIGRVTEQVCIWKGEKNDNVHVTTQLGTEIENVTGNRS